MGSMEKMDARNRGKAALLELEAFAASVALEYGSDSMCGGLLSLLGQMTVGAVMHSKPDTFKTDEERRRAVVQCAKAFGDTMQKLLAEHGVAIEYLDLSTPPAHN